MALKETGLSLGQHLVVWINEQRAGTITPAVPGLTDCGFFTDPSSATTYVGWRDGSFYVPVSLLKDGVNTIQFSPEDDAFRRRERRPTRTRPRRSRSRRRAATQLSAPPPAPDAQIAGAPPFRDGDAPALDRLRFSTTSP